MRAIYVQMSYSFIFSFFFEHRPTKKSNQSRYWKVSVTFS